MALPLEKLYQRKFGHSPEVTVRSSTEQKGKCARCGKPTDGGTFCSRRCEKLDNRESPQ